MTIWSYGYLSYQNMNVRVDMTCLLGPGLKKDHLKSHNQPEKKCAEEGSPFFVFLVKLPAEPVFL